MSSEFDITEEDFLTILDAHGKDHLARQCFEEHYDDEMEGRVDNIVQHYVTTDDQVMAAYSEIEDILVERKVVKPPKNFHSPDGDDEEDDFEPTYDSDYGDEDSFGCVE